MRSFAVALLLVTVATPALASPFRLPAAEAPPAGAGYADLVELFHEFRALRRPALRAGVPDYSAAAMQTQYDELAGYQGRLAAIDPSGWPIAEQVDYHLVRAEMNGMEFQHRVLVALVAGPGLLQRPAALGSRAGDLAVDRVRGDGSARASGRRTGSPGAGKGESERLLPHRGRPRDSCPALPGRHPRRVRASRRRTRRASS